MPGYTIAGPGPGVPTLEKLESGEYTRAYREGWSDWCVFDTVLKRGTDSSGFYAWTPPQADLDADDWFARDPS